MYLQVLGHVLYAVVMLPKFYKITSLEKKKKFIQVFSKQHSLASQNSLVVGSVGLEFCGVSDTFPASRGGGVSLTQNVQNTNKGSCWAKFCLLLYNFITKI